MKMRALLISFTIWYAIEGCGQSPQKYNSKNFELKIINNGLHLEKYKAITQDGYILRLFRIRSRSQEGGHAPVLIMHGLLQSSDGFTDAGPGAGLAYLLAGAGLDVWLGNARGNYYSREHVSLDPDAHAAYWRFSRDHIGRFDVPATIDAVLARTGATQLSYIGFSQGAGTFFMMCSEMPQYCNKARVMIALAPSTRHFYTKSLMTKLLPIFFLNAEAELAKYNIYEVFSQGSGFQKNMACFCSISSLSTEICDIISDIFDGINARSITGKTFRLFMKNFPAGTSVHNMASYGQAMTSKQFQKFDYGAQRNLQVYGRERAPVYNLSAVSAPVLVLSGLNDGVVDIRDVRWLVGQLPNVLGFREIEDPLWTHLDMTYSKKAAKLIYPKIIQYLTKK